MRAGLKLSLVAVLAVVLAKQNAFGQEEPVPVPVPPDGAPPVGVIVTAASGEDGQIQVFSTSPVGGDAATFLSTLPIFGMGGGGSTEEARWLSRPDVQKELDLVDEQVQQLNELRKKASEKSRNMFSAMREVAPAKRGAFMTEMRQVAQKEYQEELKKILLPHQSKRLEEVTLQMAMKQRGTHNLMQKKLAELLGITVEQKAELAKKQAEVAKRMKEEMERLKKEAEEEVLSVLSAKQRKKLKQLQGDKFEVKPRTVGGGSQQLLKSLQGLQSAVPGGAPSPRVRTIRRK